MTEKQKLRTSQRERLALAEKARRTCGSGVSNAAFSPVVVSSQAVWSTFAAPAVVALLGTVHRAGVWLCFLGRTTEFRLQELFRDIDPVLQRTQSRLALPRLNAKTSDLKSDGEADMDFFVFQDESASSLLQFVSPNPFGIFEPDLQSPSAQTRWQRLLSPAMQVHGVLVPGAAFDRDLNRLGWGRGYYDRFLPKLSRVPWVGLGLDESMVDRVPIEAHDQTIDGVLTEAEWTCGRSLHAKMNLQGERG